MSAVRVAKNRVEAFPTAILFLLQRGNQSRGSGGEIGLIRQRHLSDLGFKFVRDVSKVVAALSIQVLLHTVVLGL